MNSKKVLVTGSAGFIGQRLVKALLLKGHHVMGIDVKEITQPSSIYFRFAKGSINAAKLKKVGFIPEWIFHCAGGGSVGFAEKNPTKDFQMNVTSCLELLRFVRDLKSEVRIVFLSSAAVYGECTGVAQRENQVTRPVSSYGLHKRMAELIVSFYGKRWSVPSVIVRIFSVYGEGLRKQVFWDAAQRIVRGKKEFFGSGNEKRDFIHVDDVCRFLISVVFSAKCDAPVFNCGTGKPVCMKNALQKLSELLEGPSIYFNGKIRKGDPFCLVADCHKIRTLKWRPKVKFTDGIRRYAAWFKKNKPRTYNREKK